MVPSKRKSFQLTAPVSSVATTVRQTSEDYFTEMCSGSEAGSYLRLIDFSITQL